MCVCVCVCNLNWNIEREIRERNISQGPSDLNPESTTEKSKNTEAYCRNPKQSLLVMYKMLTKVLQWLSARIFY